MLSWAKTTLLDGTIHLGGMGWRDEMLAEWLATWAETHNLVIGNTHFKKRFGHKYTHTGTTGSKRQIDFILISRGAWHNVRDAYSTSKIHLGSDHRAVVLEMHIIGAKARRKYCGKKHFVQKGWTPDDPDKFKEITDNDLTGFDGQLRHRGDENDSRYM